MLSECVLQFQLEIELESLICPAVYMESCCPRSVLVWTPADTVLYDAGYCALGAFITLNPCFCSLNVQSSTFSIPKHRISSLTAQKSMFLGMIYADFTSY